MNSSEGHHRPLRADSVRSRYFYETFLLMWAQLRYTQVAQKLGFRKPEYGFDFAITFQRTSTSIYSSYGAEWLQSMGYSWEKGAGYVMPARAAKSLRVKISV